MPELPDLEVFKGNVYKRLSSKKLVDVNVYNPHKVTTPQGIFNKLFFQIDLKEGEVMIKRLNYIERLERVRDKQIIKILTR